MKVVIIGGTGLIGSKVVAKLNEHGHQAVAAAPNTGVNTVRISSALCQPMAADDVATAVARTAVGQPIGGIVEIGGPDRYPLDEFVRMQLRVNHDTRRVVADPQTCYYGVLLDQHTLIPDTTASLSETRFEDWVVANAAAPVR